MIQRSVVHTKASVIEEPIHPPEERVSHEGMACWRRPFDVSLVHRELLAKNKILKSEASAVEESQVGQSNERPNQLNHLWCANIPSEGRIVDSVDPCEM